MDKKEIVSKNAPSPAGPYSQGIVANGFVFVAGQRPFNVEAGKMAESVAEQTRQCIKNIEFILKESGSTLNDVVKANVYLSSIKHFDEMNSVYKEMFPKPFPTRTTVGVELRGIDVEIEVMALSH